MNKLLASTFPFHFRMHTHTHTYTLHGQIEEASLCLPCIKYTEYIHKKEKKAREVTVSHFNTHLDQYCDGMLGVYRQVNLERRGVS